MWADILFPLILASAAFFYGRRLHRFVGCYRKGRVGRLRLYDMAGRLCGIVMVLIMGLLDVFIRAPFMQTAAGRGFLVFYVGCVVFIVTYSNHKYVRYLKRTDVRKLPPLDAEDYRTYGFMMHGWDFRPAGVLVMLIGILMTAASL